MSRRTAWLVLGLLLAGIAAMPASAVAREEAAKAACLDSKTPAEQRVAACTRYLRGGQPPAAEQPPILLSRGRAYRVLERYPEAIADFEAVMVLQPDAPLAWRERGYTRTLTKELEGALADYDHAIALAPDEAWTHYARGNVLRDLGRGEEAVAAYEAAIALKPDYDYAVEDRADLLEDLGRLHEALAGFERASEIRPYSAWMHVRAAQLAARIARPFDAFRHYYLALQLNPNSEYAIYGLEELGVDKSRALPASPRPLAPAVPPAGLALVYLQQEIDPAAEVEIDPMEEAIMGLVGFFSGPPQKPEPISSLFVVRRIGAAEGNLVQIETLPAYPARDAASKVTEPQARFLWGLWPANFVTPQGPGPEVRYGADLERIWTSAPNEVLTGSGDVIVRCPPAGVQPDLLAALVGCEPDQIVPLGTLTWQATNVGWESVLLPVSRVTALRLNYVEDSEVTLLGKTKQRHLELTWWWSPELGIWVKRRLVKNERIEVTQLVRIGE